MDKDNLTLCPHRFAKLFQEGKFCKNCKPLYFSKDIFKVSGICEVTMQAKYYIGKTTGQSLYVLDKQNAHVQNAPPPNRLTLSVSFFSSNTNCNTVMYTLSCKVFQMHVRLNTWISQCNEAQNTLLVVTETQNKFQTSLAAKCTPTHISDVFNINKCHLSLQKVWQFSIKRSRQHTVLRPKISGRGFIRY